MRQETEKRGGGFEGKAHIRDNPDKNKFDTNKDASNKCENERIFLNLLEFT